mmetsp:Transcript_5052/g.12317  ORF Transcript_5052/g.12317 Transcript_5052/m.12317 type:complete len:201 (+) Transcript_5052:84-686(+)
MSTPLVGTLYTSTASGWRGLRSCRCSISAARVFPDPVGVESSICSGMLSSTVLLALLRCSWTLFRSSSWCGYLRGLPTAAALLLHENMAKRTFFRILSGTWFQQASAAFQATVLGPWATASRLSASIFSGSSPGRSCRNRFVRAPKSRSRIWSTLSRTDSLVVFLSSERALFSIDLSRAAAHRMGNVASAMCFHILSSFR